MRFRTTILLLLVLAGLGAYVYFIEYPQAERDVKKKTLFEFKADDATEVTLAYADAKIVLKKSGSEWRITDPLDVPADETTVKNLVSAVADCEVKRELTDPSSDLSQYGLDKPFATVTVKLGGKELPAVLVGKNAPVGFSTYIRRADDKKIVLTSSAFRSGMEKKVKDLRDKTIVNFADTDVQRLAITAADKDLRLAQKGDTWSIEQPAAFAADGSTVRSFLSTLRSLRAVDFPDDNPSDLALYGLDSPRLTITLYIGKDNAEKRILIGKENDKKEIFVQGSGRPTIYTVSEWVYRDLNKSLGDFRDKTVLAFDRDKATAVDLHRQDGGHVRLVQGKDKKWSIEGGDGKPLETAISQYVSDLHDLKGHEIIADSPADLAPFGLDRPLLKITVLGEDGKPTGTALLGAREAAGKREYTGMAEGGPTVFLVRDYLFTRLDKQAKDFVEKPTPTPGGAATPAANGDTAEEDEPLNEMLDEGEALGEQD